MLLRSPTAYTVGGMVSRIERELPEAIPGTVILWLDPVCPFSWNTARWLTAAADKVGFDIEWRLMNLATLNEGRELPPPQQARMHDSRKVGRLMVALRDELGADAMAKAYFAFGHRYFDQSALLDDELVGHVTAAVGAKHVTAAALADASLDAAVKDSHRASQEALGEAGGSPLITIDGHTVFGPVFTSVPAPDATLAVLDAVATLVRTPQFSQLQRPRDHA
jgi:2-hydroxychromene-2-carboxylate isomerase